MAAAASAERAIGVFDSGVGGLTVLNALTQALPHEDFIYLGDSARLPYGTKSDASVVRYALQAAAHLVERDIKCLVLACNTAAAAALEAVRERFGALPVLGVIGACVGAGVALVDSAATIAQATQQLLIERALLRAAGARTPQLQFLATDNVERFAAVGRRFIERPLTAADVELVDL